MLIIKKTIILFLLIIAIGCSSVNDNKKNDLTQKLDVKSIASDKFGNNYSLSYNSTNEYVLCTNNAKSKLSVPDANTLKYFVYDINNNIIVAEGNIPLGNVKWISEFEIMIEEHQGMIMKNSDAVKGYILNIKTNLKTKIDGGVH